MKIVLASYFQEENHGPGRKIGISPGKPRNIDYECESVFEPFSPGDLYWDYQKNKKSDFDAAAKAFSEGYKAQLDDFFEKAKSKAEEDGVSVIEVLPFKDGDTLLSWENKGNLSYRTALADYLREFGYDVEEN